MLVNLGLLLRQKFVMNSAGFVSSFILSDGRDEVSPGPLELRGRSHPLGGPMLHSLAHIL